MMTYSNEFKRRDAIKPDRYQFNQSAVSDNRLEPIKELAGLNIDEGFTT